MDIEAIPTGTYQRCTRALQQGRPFVFRLEGVRVEVTRIGRWYPCWKVQCKLRREERKLVLAPERAHQRAFYSRIRSEVRALLESQEQELRRGE